MREMKQRGRSLVDSCLVLYVCDPVCWERRVVLCNCTDVCEVACGSGSGITVRAVLCQPCRSYYNLAVSQGGLITNHFFSLTNTAGSGSAILLQPCRCPDSRCCFTVQEQQINPTNFTTPEVCGLWACRRVDECRHPLSQCESFCCRCHGCCTFRPKCDPLL